MKKIITAFLGLIIVMVSQAQTNTFPSSGNTGIGTTSPAGKLHLIASTTQWPLILDNTNTTYAAAQWLSNGTAFGYIGSGLGLVSGSATDFAIRAENNLILSTAGNPNMTILNNGNVGIGTTSPSYKLDVSIGTGNSGTIARFNAPSYNEVDIGVTTNRGFIGTLSTSPLSFRVNSGEKMMIDASGNVGIGTTSPGAKLVISEGGEVVNIGQTSGNTSYAGIAFTNPSTAVTFSNYALIGGAGDVLINRPSGGDLHFRESNNDQMIVKTGGNVGIGTTSPSEKLHVNGNIRVVGNLACQKVTVTQSGWPDYVFNPSFKLKPLLEVEQFIKKNNHLPGVPSAKEVENGVDLGATETVLLKKIEELTLYIIAQDKRIAELEKKQAKKK